MWNIYYLFNCETIKFIFTKTKMSKINKNVSKLIVINYLTVKYKHLKPGNMLLEYLVAVIIIFNQWFYSGLINASWKYDLIILSSAENPLPILVLLVRID